MGYAHAGNQVVLDADQQYQYAETCFNRGDYEAATAEYKRFVHFFPEDMRVEKAMFAIAMSDYHRERFQEAIAAFTEAENRFPNTPIVHPRRLYDFRLLSADERHGKCDHHPSQPAGADR